MNYSIINYLRYRFNLKKLFLEQNVILGKIRKDKTSYVKGCTLNGEITIGRKCKIYRTEIFGNVSIGDYTSIWGPNTDLVSSLNEIKIGKFCSIARNVSLQEYNHNYKEFTTYNIIKNILKDQSPKEDLLSNGAIIIENDVWISTQCIILGGAYISNGAIIAANSVVNGFVPPYAIVAGSPAKVIKYRFNDKEISELLSTEWWDWSENEIIKKIDTLRNIVK